MSLFRIAVLGPAAFGDYRLLARKLDLLLARRMPRVELLTGDGRGVAELMGWYAHAKGIRVARFREDRRAHGDGAEAVRARRWRLGR